METPIQNTLRDHGRRINLYAESRTGQCKLLKYCLLSLMVLLSFSTYSQDTTISPPFLPQITTDSNGTTVKRDSSGLLKLLKNDTLNIKVLQERVKPKDNPLNLWELFSWRKLFYIVLVMISAYAMISITTRLLYFFSETRASYRILVKGMVPILRIIFWMLVIYYIIAGIIQAPFESFIALAASIGLAVGFASQDILKNIFGGIVILLDRPFIVGDKIEVDDYYGEVIEIGLRSTRIVTPDDSQVSIPNSEMMNSSLSNTNSGETNCQVVAEVYLPITIDTEQVRQIAVEAAQVSSYIYLNKPIVVLFFNEVHERRSYLKMRLKAYVNDIRYEFEFKSEMTETVIRELLRNKVLSPEDVF